MPGCPVCPTALGGSWCAAPFEGVTIKPLALPEVMAGDCRTEIYKAASGGISYNKYLYELTDCME